ncbi:MAG: PEP-CTERM sorting domain-containing protein [Fimbriimonadaceae bacterium]|nr:PEP-CTERM sorting domain-containing protein [Fimbriimonadaceae bacterium]QYK56173.1 MAG: PEP-CTERM sorting domain-containing protein [Fimbriimonadaceae bacterium]
MKIVKVSTLATLLALAGSASAITDPVGDFIPTYTGPQAGDVDVTSASVQYDGTSFIFHAEMAANIGLTQGALYIWGLDRGQGTARFFPDLPQTEQIKFDSVLLMRPDGSATVNRIVGGGQTNFDPGSVLISGNRLSFTVAASEFPTLGLSPDKYTWNLWPRVGTGQNSQISDFAPDTTNASVEVVPEPATLTFVGAAALALLRRKRK